MYDFVDRPLISLDHNSRFALWAMRAWVLAIWSRRCPMAALAAIFAKWEMAAALADFHTFMTILNGHGQAAIRFAPPCCAFVGDDEAVLLAMVATAAAGDSEQLRATTGLLIGPSAAAAAVDALERFADQTLLSPLVQLGKPSFITPRPLAD